VVAVLKVVGVVSTMMLLYIFFTLLGVLEMLIYGVDYGGPGETLHQDTFDTTDIREFLLPPADCENDISIGGTAYLFMVILLYVPAQILVAIVLLPGLLSIVFAGAITEDTISDIYHRLRLRAAELEETGWDTMVREPIILLARDTMPKLSKLSSGPVAAIFVGWWGHMILLVPFIVQNSDMEKPHKGNLHAMLMMLILLVVPLFMLAPLAIVSSACDVLEAKLNDLRAERPKKGTHQQRVMHLQEFLLNINKRQGLGVVWFGTVPTPVNSNIH
jgi:hypothetical protein